MPVPRGCINASWDRRGGIDESSPFERVTICILREVHSAWLGTRVSAGLAVLVGEVAGAVSKFAMTVQFDPSVTI
jgi:hypothetical protein